MRGISKNYEPDILYDDVNMPVRWVVIVPILCNIRNASYNQPNGLDYLVWLMFAHTNIGLIDKMPSKSYIDYVFMTDMLFVVTFIIKILSHVLCQRVS
jgi:hypothetical protein